VSLSHVVVVIVIIVVMCVRSEYISVRKKLS